MDGRLDLRDSLKWFVFKIKEFFERSFRNEGTGGAGTRGVQGMGTLVVRHMVESRGDYPKGGRVRVAGRPEWK